MGAAAHPSRQEQSKVLLGQERALKSPKPFELVDLGLFFCSFFLLGIYSHDTCIAYVMGPCTNTVLGLLGILP